jgi:hypothetical protein
VGGCYTLRVSPPKVADGDRLAGLSEKVKEQRDEISAMETVRSFFCLRKGVGGGGALAQCLPVERGGHCTARPLRTLKVARGRFTANTSVSVVRRPDGLLR